MTNERTVYDLKKADHKSVVQQQLNESINYAVHQKQLELLLKFSFRARTQAAKFQP